MKIRDWARRWVCFVQGHNLVGVPLPTGWSRATCLMCGREIDAFRRDAS